MSDHQKQFAYLPLHVLKKATNIVKLTLEHVLGKGQERHLDDVIIQIHEQMSTRANWLSVLDNLHFIDPVEFEEDTEVIEPQTLSNSTRSLRKSRVNF